MSTLLLILALLQHPDSAYHDHPDSTYHDHLAAARASTPTAATHHLLVAYGLLHGHPDLLYLLARNATALKHPQTAVSLLRKIAAMGLVYDIEKDSALAPLRGRSDFAAVLSAMAANKTPMSHATTVLTFSDPDLLTEDVAYDSVTRAFYVSSIHRSKIIDTTGGMFDGTSPSPMALIVDAKRRTLWASVAPMPQGDSSGRSGVLQYDLATRRLMHRYDLPDDGKKHALGDMTLDAEGNPIVSDGEGGGVYVVDRQKQTLETLVAPGTFESPQNPAVAPDGRILVADYAKGIGTIDPNTHEVTWMMHSDTVALSGIDGMYLVGRVLYAIQNGTNPERVTRFELDPNLREIVNWSVVEQATPDFGDPTHGVVVGNDFYFIANSGWDRFADDGHITKPGTPARLQKVSVDLPQ